jgi:hypothetical protein
MRMMIKVLVRTLAYHLVLPMLITVAATFTAAAAEPGYAGWKTCAVCHRTVSANWQKSRHAQAYESLTKSKQGDLPGCVRCHVTGYEKESGFIDYELTPELAGIQCEECHGPGSTHLKSSIRADAAIRRGRIPASTIRRRFRTYTALKETRSSVN